VDFFLLGDYLNENGSVRFSLPFEGFITDPVPHSAEEYSLYKRNVIEVVTARKQRIESYIQKRDA
jgi:hypothetical protein